jgi:hypothetical protein
LTRHDSVCFLIARVFGRTLSWSGFAFHSDNAPRRERRITRTKSRQGMS